MELLIILVALVAGVVGYAIGFLVMRLRMLYRVRDERKDAVKRSRAVISGHVAEQLAPYLPNFPWNPGEARFIGKPVDFLIFKGLEDRRVEEVIFVEVKSGGSRLSPVERSLRDAVQQGRVSWKEYRHAKNS